jgi:hypothetical protein
MGQHIFFAEFRNANYRISAVNIALQVSQKLEALCFGLLLIKEIEVVNRKHHFNSPITLRDIIRTVKSRMPQSKVLHVRHIKFLQRMLPDVRFGTEYWNSIIR